MTREISRKRTLVRRAFQHVDDNLSRRVVHGAAFTFIGIAGRTLITIASMAVLARLLAPTDFGHVAMATVVTELAALFANFGFGSILIQRSRITRLQLDTIFWSSLALGAFLSILVFATSWISEALLGDPVAGQLLRVLCLSFVFDQLTVVPAALLSRLFMFRHVLLIQLIALSFRAASAVLLAVAGFGVWSLAGGAVIGQMAQWAAYGYVAGFRPRPRFDRAFLSTTWRINGSYFGAGLVFYANSNIDLLIVGRTMGAHVLGYYQNARALTDEIRVRIAIPLHRVLFPAFSAIQSDLPRFQDGVRRSGRLLSLVAIPVGFGIAAVADELVPVLYGRQWSAMIPMLQIISAGAGIRAATTIGTPIYNATNRTGLALRLNTIASVLFVASVMIATQWGLLGISFALLFSAMLSIVVLRVALGIIGLSTVHLWEILGAPVLAATTMLIVLELVRPAVADWLPTEAPRLAVLAGLGSILYAALMLAIGRSHLRTALEAVRHLRAGQRATSHDAR